MLIIIKNIIGSKQNDTKHNNDKYTLIKDYNNVLHMPHSYIFVYTLIDVKTR